MIKLRKDSLNTKQFVLVYVCVPYAIKDLCMDIIKAFFSVKHFLKLILYQIYTIKSSHLFLWHFDKLRLEKLKKKYILLVLTKSRWGTMFFTTQRTKKIKVPFTTLLEIILNADLDTNITDDLIH